MNWRDLIKLTPIYNFFGKRSYSQSGEDVVVDAILNRKKSGYYIDIGAYHPKVFSNTYMFYKRGWSGVCVDANPELSLMYHLVRPRDIFVNCGVADVSVRLAQKSCSDPTALRLRGPLPRDFVSKSAPSYLEYFVFDEEAANTFDKKLAKKNIKAGRKLIKKMILPMMEINRLLKSFVPEKQKIDLLSIDVEGMDERILRDLDFGRWRPEVIVCEDLNGGSLKNFLEGKGYVLVGLTGLSMVFRDQI